MKKYIKEYKIGEQFKIDKLTLEVRQATNGRCVGCTFWYESELGYHCTDHEYKSGRCSCHTRRDGKDVIFVKVGEEDL